MKKTVFLGAFVSTLFFASTALAFLFITRYPSADVVVQNWVPSSWTVPRYRLVNEAVCDGNGTYMYSTTTVDGIHTFALDISAIPDGKEISTISFTPCASLYDQSRGSAVLGVFYRWNGVASVNSANYLIQNGTVPVVRPTRTLLTNLIKQSGSVLEVGIRNEGSPLGGNGGGLKVSQIKVDIAY